MTAFEPEVTAKPARSNYNVINYNYTCMSAVYN